MAWTAPKTWSVSEVVTASMMNTHVRDNLKFLKGQAGTVAIEDAMTVAGSVVATAGGNNQGVLSALSGSSSVLAGIGVGRTANEVQMAIVASAAQFFAGSAAGDMVLRDIDSTKKTMLGSGATAVMTLAPGPLVGIGTTAPEGTLHVRNLISGAMHWEYDGVDGTARTVITNGTGDVVYYCTGLFVVRTSAGGLGASNSLGIISPGVTQDIYNSGGNVCQFQVAANGSVTVQRTAGALTYKVALWLLWI